MSYVEIQHWMWPYVHPCPGKPKFQPGCECHFCQAEATERKKLEEEASRR